MTWTESLVLDASGKVASGLLVGTIGDLGNFDECLATTVENMYGERDFTGRFCTVYMNFKNNTFVAKMVARYTLATVAILVAAATAADVALRTVLKRRMSTKPKGILYDVVYGFSVVSNTEKLLKTDPSDPADSKLKFIHGLRFYSSTWVMLGHAFLIADPTATGSLMNVVDLVEDFLTTLIANAFPSVETFLFISGFLVSYNVQKTLRNKTKLIFWVPLIILRRYIRRPYLGALFAALATVVSSAYTGVVSYLNNYQPAVIFTHTDVSYTIGTANQIYFKPFAHVGSFCIGVLLGYYIYVAPKMKLSKPVQVLCWCAATACNLAIVLAPHKWYTDHSYSIKQPECLLYASLHRVAWTLGVAWLVFACATGRGGIVMSLLSWPALVPLSRLSYGAFLCHVVILLVQMMTNRERIAYTYMVKTMNYLAVVMASYLCAYLLYLFCEAPVATLERTLLGGIGSPRRGGPASRLTVIVPKAADQHLPPGSSLRELPATPAAAEESSQRSHL
ncbi:hypothetical protein V5799_011786 [Amblyomma americanum]|uniref:Nose resistant-to-fluoxetine protein N-terminal domain-containing protein n=1 Tax=Amblyomma americanum TaxID=6943 RepID=A0AAQ4EG87_AMBAM